MCLIYLLARFFLDADFLYITKETRAKIVMKANANMVSLLGLVNYSASGMK